MQVLERIVTDRGIDVATESKSCATNRPQPLKES